MSGRSTVHPCSSVFSVVVSSVFFRGLSFRVFPWLRNSTGCLPSKVGGIQPGDLS